MRAKLFLWSVLIFALVLLAPMSVSAQDGATPSPPFNFIDTQLFFVQNSLPSPSAIFAQGLPSGNGYTPLTQGRGTFTSGNIQRATDGRYFVLISLSNSSQQTLGLLISSFDQSLLLNYLNSAGVFFAAMVVPTGIEPGFGSMPGGDDVYYIQRQTGDIDVEMALLPQGSVNPNQDYAVYFAVDPVLSSANQAHLYHSPRWKSVYTWAVADGGSISYQLWRNNPGAYAGEIDHRAGQPMPQPLYDEVSSGGTAQYNALITNQSNRSSYRLYGGFTTTPQTITPPESINPFPSCPLPPRMTVGQLGQVMGDTPLPNRLRRQPSLSGSIITTIPINELFSVIGGPKCANGILWWQVDYGGRTGWTAEGQNGVYYIRPH